MSDSKKAISFMFLAVLCFSCANFFVKTLSLYFDSFQILLFRAIPMFLISYFLIRKHKLNPFGNKKLLLILRSLICVFSIVLYYKSFKMLDIGAAVSLRYLAPVFSIFVALIILKNKLHPINIITSILAISSVVLICAFSSSYNIQGISIALFAAFLLSISWVLVSKIGSDDSPLVIVLYLSFFCVLVGVVTSTYYSKWNLDSVNYTMIFKMFFLGIFGYLGQYYSTKAFQIGNPRDVAPFRYFEILVSMILGVLFVNETYTLISIIGSLLLIFSLMITFFDLDNSGAIDFDDYRILKEKLDLNKDGKIDYKDFVFLLKERISYVNKVFSQLFK